MLEQRQVQLVNRFGSLPHPTRRSTTLSSKVDVSYAIDLRDSKSPSNIGRTETSVAHRVEQSSSSKAKLGRPSHSSKSETPVLPKRNWTGHTYHLEHKLQY
jgi:hypothetical protein